MTAFPQSLKSWRKARRFSQMDLALEADVSTRHISFLETGRARPSRDMIARLGDALDMPLDARNQMMVHAGFAPRYTRRAWNADDMAPIRDAVEHMLENHAPYPALALDRDGTLMRMNIPAQALFGMLEINEGDSLLDVVLSDQMPDVIENWPEVAHHTAQRLRTESTAQGGNDRFDSAADVLSRVLHQNRVLLARSCPQSIARDRCGWRFLPPLPSSALRKICCWKTLKSNCFFPRTPRQTRRCRR